MVEKDVDMSINQIDHRAHCKLRCIVGPVNSHQTFFATSEPCWWSWELAKELPNHRRKSRRRTVVSARKSARISVLISKTYYIPMQGAPHLFGLNQSNQYNQGMTRRMLEGEESRRHVLPADGTKQSLCCMLKKGDG